MPLTDIWQGRFAVWAAMKTWARRGTLAVSKARLALDMPRRLAHVAYDLAQFDSFSIYEAWKRAGL